MPGITEIGEIGLPQAVSIGVVSNRTKQGKGKSANNKRCILFLLVVVGGCTFRGSMGKGILSHKSRNINYVFTKVSN